MSALFLGSVKSSGVRQIKAIKQDAFGYNATQRVKHQKWVSVTLSLQYIQHIVAWGSYLYGIVHHHADYSWWVFDHFCYTFIIKISIVKSKKPIGGPCSAYQLISIRGCGTYNLTLAGEGAGTTGPMSSEKGARPLRNTGACLSHAVNLAVLYQHQNSVHYTD